MPPLKKLNKKPISAVKTVVKRKPKIGGRIYKVLPELVGEKVSHQCAGMHEPEYGVINAVAEVKEHVFFKKEGDKTGKLMPIAFLRFGWGAPFYKQFEVPDKPGNFFWRDITHE